MYPVKWKFPSDFRHNEITSFWAPTWVADIHESLWDLIPPPHPLWTEIGPKICSTLRKYASMALKTVWNEHFWRQKTNIFGVRIGLKIVKSCLRCVRKLQNCRIYKWCRNSLKCQHGSTKTCLVKKQELSRVKWLLRAWCRKSRIVPKIRGGINTKYRTSLG